MTKFLLLAITFALSFDASSQGYTLTFENGANKEKNFPIDINIKSDGSSILLGTSKMNAFTAEYKEMTITNYSDEMQVKSRSKFSLKDFDNMNYEMSYTSSSNTVYVILSDYDFKSHTKDYYTYKISNNGTIDKSSKSKLFTANNVSRDDGDLLLLMSDDKTQKYINFINKKDFVFSTKNSLRLMKLKGENEIEWDKTLIKETAKRDKNIIGVIVSNNGEILVHYTSRKNSDDARVTNQYSLYSSSGELLSSTSAESKGKYYDYIKFIPNRDGSFNIYGFYSNSNKLQKFNGVSGFNYSITTHKLSKLFEFPLESDLLSNILKEKKAAKGAEKGIPSNYKLRYVFTDEKGNTIIAAEEEYIDDNSLGGKKSTSQNSKKSFFKTIQMGPTVNGIDGGSYQNNQYLINGNVLIFSISNDGSILWSNSILKFQKVPTTLAGNMGNNSSYYMTSNSEFFNKQPIGIYGFDDINNVYFFLNDNGANVDYQTNKENEKKKTKKMTNVKKADAFVYQFSKADGSKSVKELYDGKGNKKIIYPKTSIKVNNEKHIVYATTLFGNDDLGILTVNNPSSPLSEKPVAKPIKETTNVSESESSTPTSDGETIVADSDTSMDFKIPDAKEVEKPINTAVSNGVPMMENEEANAPRELKYKANESEVDKYIELRKKFEIEAEEQKKKDELEAKEKAAKAAKEYNDRHANPQEVTEFDQFRQGKKETKTIETKSAQEEYNELFK